MNNLTKSHLETAKTLQRQQSGLSYVVMYMGRPQAQHTFRGPARRFVETRVRNGGSPGREFYWTQSGKMMVRMGETLRFTGWECLKVATA